MLSRRWVFCLLPIFSILGIGHKLHRCFDLYVTNVSHYTELLACIVMLLLLVQIYFDVTVSLLAVHPLNLGSLCYLHIQTVSLVLEQRWWWKSYNNIFQSFTLNVSFEPDILLDKIRFSNSCPALLENAFTAFELLHWYRKMTYSQNPLYLWFQTFVCVKHQ